MIYRLIINKLFKTIYNHIIPYWDRSKTNKKIAETTGFGYFNDQFNTQLDLLIQL